MVVAVAKEIHYRAKNSLPVYDAQDRTKGGDLAQINLEK